MMNRRDYKFWIKALAVLGLLLMVVIVHHAVDADHHDDHNFCPLCVSLAGLIFFAVFVPVFSVVAQLFQVQHQTLAAVSVDFGSSRKRGPPLP
jgi:uncharacterized membrane protein YhaH (DUF805 family)